MTPKQITEAAAWLKIVSDIDTALEAIRKNGGRVQLIAIIDDGRKLDVGSMMQLSSESLLRSLREDARVEAIKAGVDFEGARHEPD